MTLKLYDIVLPIVRPTKFIYIGIIIKPLLSYMTLWMVSVGGNLHEPYFQVSMPVRMYIPSANLTQ